MKLIALETSFILFFSLRPVTFDSAAHSSAEHKIRKEGALKKMGDFEAAVMEIRPSIGFRSESATSVTDIGALIFFEALFLYWSFQALVFVSDVIERTFECFF